MGVKKVQLSTGEVLIDLSSDNITSDKVLEGTTFHRSDGEVVTGNIQVKSGENITLATTEAQNIPSGYYDGTTTVGVAAGNIKSENIKKDVDILGVVGTYEAEDPELQMKTATPTFETQYVLPDTGYDYLTEVDVTPIPVRDESLNDGVHRIIGNGNGPLIPTDVNLGTATFNENGIYKASDDGYDGFSQVEVNVSGGGLVETTDEEGHTIIEYVGTPATFIESEDLEGHVTYEYKEDIVKLKSLDINENGIYKAPDEGYDGYSILNVQTINPIIINESYNGFHTLANTFNLPVEITNNVDTCFGTFSGFGSFNYPVTIPNNVKNCSAMFSSCGRFNQLVNIPDSVTNCAMMFQSCYNFNYPVTIPNNVKNCSAMFSSCGRFNQLVNIPDSVTNCAMMFQSCYNLNSPVTIGNNVTDCAQMFNHCDRFNQLVNIPDSVIRCYNMFDNCVSFNQPITIPNNVTSCAYMFYNCRSLNSPVTIGNGVINSVFMFYNCRSLNSPITIGNGVTRCYNMFDNCVSFNQPITIPNSVEYCNNMFSNCSNMSSNIYIDRTATLQANNFLRAHPRNLQINIFCNNLSILNNTSAAFSITGASMTWTPMTNGYYNEYYNIYLYNNYTSGGPSGLIP